MIYEVTRNGREFRVCAQPFILGEGIPDMIINGNGCWIEESIKGTRLKVHVFEGHGFNAQLHTQYINWWVYDLDKVDFEEINNRTFTPKKWNEPEVYAALSNITETHITTEQDIFRRAINGIFEKSGLDYVFDENLNPIP